MPFSRLSFFCQICQNKVMLFCYLKSFLFNVYQFLRQLPWEGIVSKQVNTYFNENLNLLYKTRQDCQAQLINQKGFHFCVTFILSYRLTTAKFSLRKDSIFTLLQSSLIIIKYVEARNTTMVWRAGQDMGEGWSVSEWILRHCQSVTKSKNNTNIKTPLIFKLIDNLFGCF